MNVLNKGRCTRCLACEKKATIVRNKKNPNIEKIVHRNFCTYYDKWCRGISSHCKESPMGVSSKDYERRTMKGENV